MSQAWVVRQCPIPVGSYSEEGINGQKNSVLPLSDVDSLMGTGTKYPSGQSERWRELFYGGAVKFQDGYALPPEGPGLGINLDEKFAAKYPYKPKNWRSHRFRDGSIADR